MKARVPDDLQQMLIGLDPQSVDWLLKHLDASELEQFLRLAGPTERMEVLRAMRTILAHLENFAAAHTHP